MPPQDFYTKKINDLFHKVSLGQLDFLTIFGEKESEETEGIIKILESLKSEEVIILTHDCLKSDWTPFDPYLRFIREKTIPMETQEVKKLLDELEIYTPHKVLLSTYLEGKEVRRKERLLLDEYNFDNQKLLESMWSLFKYLYRDKKVIALIENADFLPVSTCQWLAGLAEKDERFPLLSVLIVSNAMSNLLHRETRENALTRLRISGDLLRLGSKKKKLITAGKPLPPIQEVLSQLVLNLEFLAFEDALEIISEVESSSDHHIDELDFHQQVKLYKVKIRAQYYAGDFHNALNICSTLQKIANKNNSASVIADAYWHMGLIYYSIQNPSKALGAVTKSMDLSKELNDDKIHYYNLYLLLLIDGKERILEGEKWKEIYFELIRLGRKLRFSSTLACWLARPDRLVLTTDIETIDGLQEEAIKLCRESGNLFRLASAYHTRAFAFIFREDYESAHEYYSMCIKLKARLGNVLEMAYTNNGFGRFYYQIGEYETADAYYFKALEASMQVGDYREIAMSMCNLGMNYLFGFDYRRALPYLENLNELMILMKIGDLSYHSSFQVRSLLALSYLKNGERAKAKDLVSTLKNTISLRESLTTMPYETLSEELLDYYLLMAVYYSSSEKKEKALKAIEHCESFYIQNQHIHHYFSPVLYYELGECFLNLAMEEEADRAFETGLESIKADLHNQYREILAEKRRNHNLSPAIFKAGGSTFDFDMIKMSAQNSKDIDNLQIKIEEIHFLNSVQELLTSNREKEEFLSGSMDLLNYYFKADFITLFSQSEGQWKRIYTQSDQNESSLISLLESIEEITSPGKPVILNIEQMHGYFPDSPLMSLIGIPLPDVGFYLICGSSDRENPLNREDYNILSLFTGLLRSGIEKADYIASIEEINRELHQANEQLELTARTDALTNLSNRKALLDKIDDEQKRISRYHQDELNYLSLLFIDLDNFKYYNDRFGHDAGDLILVLFSEILQQVCRESDFISRYGGDEFVLLLPETSEKGALKLAKRIHEELKISQYFHREIETHVKSEIEIPLKERISCSIGISSCYQCKNILISDLIKEADQAVYEAKGSGKACIKVYRRDKTS